MGIKMQQMEASQAEAEEAVAAQGSIRHLEPARQRAVEKVGKVEMAW
jgi:hypothetical protein